ncbi:MAG: hypothetical protein GQ570_11995 [Helicobacteraceae bacterium]|nr:hypothetical protein [Helicobacteraceae bacterium]
MKNTLLITSLFIGSTLLSSVQENNITFTFLDSNTTITSIELIQDDTILTTTSNVCGAGVTYTGNAGVTDSDKTGDFQCVVSDDLTYTIDTISYRSAQTSSDSIGKILKNYLPTGNVMNTYTNPFTSEMNSSCQLISITNNIPKELYFLFNIDMEFDLNGTSVTCENIVLAQEGIETTVKGILQAAAVQASDSDKSYKASKKVYYQDPKADTKTKAKGWFAAGKAIVSQAEAVKDEVDAAIAMEGSWWMGTSTVNEVNGSNYTLQPYYGPEWLYLTNQNYKNAIQCSDNYTLFVTYSDNNSSKEQFFVQFLQSE